MPLTKQEANRIGLCADCVYAKRINNDRGSTFHLCELSKKDPAFPKYPRLPVVQCKGYKKEGINIHG